MRRKDREITDADEIMRIIGRCDVCRLGINVFEGVPYIVPLNFGFEMEGETPVLFFHSAASGRKIELLKEHRRVAVEMDCSHSVVSSRERGYCTMNFESIMGEGDVEFVDDEQEKMRLLTLLTDRYHSSHFEFNPAMLSVTSVFRLRLENMTAKRNRKEFPAAQ